MLTKYLERRALLFILQYRKDHPDESTPYGTMLAMLTKFLGVTDEEIQEWAGKTMAVPGLKGLEQPDVRAAFQLQLIEHGIPTCVVDDPDFTVSYKLTPAQEKRVWKWAASDPPIFHHEPYHPLAVMECFNREFPDLRDATTDWRLGWMIPLSSSSVKWVVDRARTWLKDDYGVVYEEGGQPIGAISISSTNCGPQVVEGTRSELALLPEFPQVKRVSSLRVGESVEVTAYMDYDGADPLSAEYQKFLLRIDAALRCRLSKEGYWNVRVFFGEHRETHIVGPWSISSCKSFDRELAGAKAYDHALSPQEIADEHRTFQQAHNRMNRKPTEAFPELFELFQASKHFGPSPYRIVAARARLAMAQCRNSSHEDRARLEVLLGCVEEGAHHPIESRAQRERCWGGAWVNWKNISKISEGCPTTTDLGALYQSMLEKIYVECGEPVSTEEPVDDLTGEDHLDDLHKFLTKSERLQRKA